MVWLLPFGLIGASYVNIKSPQHKDLKNPNTELLVIAGAVCFAQRRARQQIHGDLQRSDHSSL